MIKLLSQQKDRLGRIYQASMDTSSRIGSRDGAANGLVQSRAGVPDASGQIQSFLDNQASQLGLSMGVAKQLQTEVKEDPLAAIATTIRYINSNF